MERFIGYLINGLSTGSIYALVALGYTMVYGIIKLINFAHGDFIMVGCFTVFYLLIKLNASPFIAIAAAVLVCVILGVTTEKIAYKPLRKSKRITALITAIGVSIIIENVFLNWYSKNELTNSEKYFNIGYIQWGNVLISGVSLLILGILVVSTIILTLFISYTNTGKAMRAVSENTAAAELMGINVDRTISITFAIGCTLAGIASIMYYLNYPQIGATLGSTLGIKAFVAAVLGGIGLIPGAVLGGLIIGIIEGFAIGFGFSQWVDVILFLILILVLILKPTGILGKSKKEKV